MTWLTKKNLAGTRVAAITTPGDLKWEVSRSCNPMRPPDFRTANWQGLKTHLEGLTGSICTRLRGSQWSEHQNSGVEVSGGVSVKNQYTELVICDIYKLKTLYSVLNVKDK